MNTFALHHLQRPLVALSLSLGLLSLAGCSAMSAQNPSSALKPVNAVEMPPDARVMLQGADVVAYFTQNTYAQGNPAFKSSYEGVSFYFASAEHKAAFDQAPARYLPQYGGYCANGVVYGIPWGGDADTWKLIDGKLYIFGGQGSKDAFELDEKANLALAEKYWNEEVKGSNSFAQRAKRLVLRVPHYQSGEALAKAVAEAKARQP
ncbi:MAG: YHS domain-containing (seleno)protein [Hydrogenophaga sp.]|jgi:YHS domain-containing protein|uniref:YHS domain-containing (seleno)protein n=1 Tax=Hydrogenophaga sp. TaxID=1904254 RepID=UPI00271B330C|nr:YHS domain-containing (seleno)protein [Hydrogenophaga sp.]MDO9202653.1 YHS domain-containing (seleno)protein [Hydrogenophaga sp.]MDO9479964.1 YHS domain-containing (seleno)protein [Hydrogenophaga sp.]MDO9567972.1 YHS domain-containing (seleno)protein [Hydrogenophaga sp.]MDP1893405.1 YHS domain-containing (seleno)protein [Hydrogenophaga sp.]MDP3346141.1 YHS domain-containing (seleno)protein [Hydrogenophaga sp.]